MPSAQQLKRKKSKSGRDQSSDIKIPKSKTGHTRRPDDNSDLVIEFAADEALLAADIAETAEKQINKNSEQSSEESSNLSDINIDIETGASRMKKQRKTKKLQLPKLFGFSMGAQILKSKFPKSFGIAEKVVEDWMADGDFSDIPIDTPLVQFYVGEGLRRVKKVEKKIEARLDDAGVLPIVRHQIGRAQKWINKK